MSPSRSARGSSSSFSARTRTQWATGRAPRDPFPEAGRRAADALPGEPSTQREFGQAPGACRASARRPPRTATRATAALVDSSLRHGRDSRVGEPHELAGIELDLQPAPPRADEDRGVVERGLVDCRRQSAPLSQRADPTGDVAGCALGLGAVGHLGALADRPEVELPVGGDDEDLQLPADRGEERLEQARGLDTERSGNGDRVVRLAGIDALVLVDREVDARRPRGLDRRGHGAVVKLSRGCDRTRQRRRYNDMVRFRTTLVVLASLTLLGAAAPAQAASGRLVAFRSCPDLVNYAKANA